MARTSKDPVVVAELFGPTARVQATVVESKLKSAGIESRLGDEAVTELGIDTDQFGTVKVVVAASDAARAHAVLEPDEQ